MTDSERIAAAIAISLAVHWLVFKGITTPSLDTGSNDMIVVDFTPPAAAVSLAAPMTLEEAGPPQESRENRADRRRQALAAYLEAVSDAVHARRMTAVGGSAIGNARISLTIDASGGFTDVHLLQSSGNAALDRDAQHAARAASGAVPRPPILGTAPLRLDLRVKYQYGL
ncbi:TonB family protein [Breoghania sp.]|uniref:energy transducer TonB family protein n=1 Tax=Breoghania sp. TaxID=2065378 RepID=UPI002AA78085|nr:TonB family protein [Breoghania sp.]